ncbi:MAG: cupredoxin domain-containing protein [Bacillota bacterium]
MRRMRRFGPTGLLVAALLALLAAGAQGARRQAFTVVMGEYSFDPATLTVSAGSQVEITLVNQGRLPHEFMVYPSGPNMPMERKEMHEWVEANSMLKGVETTVEVDGNTISGTEIMEVVVKPGARVSIRFVPARTGTFEFACLIPGHYEQGQKGQLIVK